MAKSILINSFSLCQNLNSPEKFGIDAVGNLTNNEHLHFYYVVDGHGGCRNSNILVKNFQAYVHSLKDNFAQLNNDQEDIHNFLKCLIEQFYIEHRGKLRPAAMSILMVIVSQNRIYSAHLGDCRLGKINNKQEITWITYPHNLVMSLNKETDSQSIEMVLRSANSNIVTKSFNTRKLKSLSFNVLDIEKKSTYILASDGFWKLPEKDIKTIIHNENLSGTTSLFDDTSLWAISIIECEIF
ncbi:serine/threonine protein phosphatase [Acinetobacter variabilis]|uniref:serine/threonine protein phosphatase n=1 Tax=Acinetobacter variabilis TaxID=70346 RepID=UPI002FD9290A